MRARRWGGGFGTKVFLLTASVAVVAAGATAFLTVRQATSQVTESAEVAQQDVDRIVRTLADAGVLRSEWGDLRGTVEALAEETGERIRVTTARGELVVDSDTLHGGHARPLSGRAALTVDPRPVPDYTGVLPENRFGDTLVALTAYLESFRAATCLAERGESVQWTRGLLGVPVVDPKRMADTVAMRCDTPVTGQPMTADPGEALLHEYLRCGGTMARDTTGPPPALSPNDDVRLRGLEHYPAQDVACLQQAFRALDTTPAPEPLTLSLGTGDEPRTAPIDLWPALVAAAAVALVAMAGTALLSRRVLRPIASLTAAARTLGDGDLAERVPVRGHDQIAELATSFNRMAASLRASKDQQRTMVGDIAHELRTPLANIRGYLEALKDGVLAPDPELFQSLHEEAVLQQRLIDDLQELAEAESGTMIYHRTRFDVAELLSTSRTAHLAAAEARGVRLEVTVHGRPVIDGDADRLRQVIGNLVTNALRATSPGGTVTLRAQAQPDAVYVAVADTGHGIAADDLAHVFDRFWRADNARSRSTGGSGLGLAIAREIIAAHDGSISVESTVGTGTVFTIRFPGTDR